MAIFKRKQKKQAAEDSYRFMTVEQALAYSRGERVVTQAQILDSLEDTCKQLCSIEAQQAEAKAEFSAVTSYLSDISKLESIPQSQKNIITDIAESIINISMQREDEETTERKLTDVQYKNLKIYEDEIPSQISKMEENERFQVLVSNDIKQLEGEKGSILYEIDYQRRRRRMLRSFLTAACTFTVCAFALLIFLTNSTDKDFTVPFFVTGVMALGAAFYVIVSLRSATLQIMKGEQKHNRVISLLNKVKIKYVNVTNVLEYSYDKYNVHSHHELAYLWQLYLHEKHIASQKQQSAQRLNSMCGALVDELRRWQISDCSVWTRQPQALVDRRELIDVRNRLEERHNRLRAAIEFGNKQLATLRNEIQRIKEKYPEQEHVINTLLRDYNISL